MAGGYQSPEEVAAFRELVAELPHPLLAFCDSTSECLAGILGETGEPLEVPLANGPVER